jgi:hypothetical protein
MISKRLHLRHEKEGFHWAGRAAQKRVFAQISAIDILSESEKVSSLCNDPKLGLLWLSVEEDIRYSHLLIEAETAPQALSEILLTDRVYVFDARSWWVDYLVNFYEPKGYNLLRAILPEAA